MGEPSSQPIRGRGVPDNPTSRFASTFSERFEDYDPTEDPAPRTQFMPDASATIITDNDSPDIPFDASINIYRLRNSLAGSSERWTQHRRIGETGGWR